MLIFDNNLVVFHVMYLMYLCFVCLSGVFAICLARHFQLFFEKNLLVIGIGFRQVVLLLTDFEISRLFISLLHLLVFEFFV